VNLTAHLHLVPRTRMNGALPLLPLYTYVFLVLTGEKFLLFGLIELREVSSNKSPTRCNNFPVYYPDVYLQLNMFRTFPRPSSGAQLLQWQPLVLPSYRGDNRAVFVVGSENYCIWLVIYLKCTMMHGLTKLKFKGSMTAGLWDLYKIRKIRTEVSLNKRRERKVVNV
jgi:hypothetical protein